METVNQKELANELINNAWNNFKKYYDNKAFIYSKNKKLVKDKKEAEDAHWICWNESDLMVQIARFFYRELDQQNTSSIEMHFDKNISKRNFDDYAFEKKLDELKKNLGRVPKVDLIITEEDSKEPFLICAEAKQFHYSQESISRGKSSALDLIKKDIRTLLEIKKLGVAKIVVFILFDDYYYLNEKNISNKINDFLETHKKEIVMLNHTTSAKVEHWPKN